MVRVSVADGNLLVDPALASLIEEIARQGGIPMVVRLLKHESDAVLHRACGMLCNVSSWSKVVYVPRSRPPL